MLSIGLAVMCAAVGASMIGIILPHLGARIPLTFFLRVIGLAGVLSVGCTALYVVSLHGGDRLSCSAADALMVATPLVVGVSTTSPGSRRMRAVLALAIVLPAAVASSSLLLPAEVSHIVRIAAVTLACALGALLAFTSVTVPRRSVAAIVVSMTTYAVYSLARTVVALSPAATSDVARTVFSHAASAGVATACVLLIGVAVVLVRRSPHPDLTGGGTSWTRLVVGDWRAAIRTHGTPTVLALVSELRSAARDLDPSSVDVHRGVDVPCPAALPAVSRVLRETYGWGPENFALLRTPEPLPRPTWSSIPAARPSDAADG
ncbi:hypothetical protein RKD05_001890 [Microbacterium sp. SLBN-111]